MVTLNNQIWIIGGNNGNTGTSYETYRLINNAWIEGPELIRARAFHACAATKSDAFNGEQIIIVAGGFSAFEPMTSVEFHREGEPFWFRG